MFFNMRDMDLDRYLQFDRMSECGNYMRYVYLPNAESPGFGVRGKECYHAGTWYGLASIVGSGIIAPSTDPNLGHGYWKSEVAVITLVPTIHQASRQQMGVMRWPRTFPTTTLTTSTSWNQRWTRRGAHTSNRRPEPPQLNGCFSQKIPNSRQYGLH